MGCIPFHIGLYLWKVPAVQSLSHASGVPAPLTREPLAAPPVPGGSGKEPILTSSVRIDRGGTPPLLQGSPWVQYRSRALEGE